MSHAALRLKAYLTPYAGGQLDMGINEDFDPAKYNRNRIARLVDEYRDKLLGLKIRLQYGIEPTEKARDYMQGVIDLANEMTERTGVPLRVCVHTTDCQLSAGELAGMLRPGDIFTHCFQGKRHNLVLDDGTIDPGVLEARERGVIFDACNGMGNYGVDVCKKALSQDFFPDVISSDETIEKCNLPMYTKSLPFIASKYLSLGMDFHEVFRAMTQTPAKLMDMEGRIGTLAPGAYADVAIFKYRTDLEVRHVDSLGVEFVGHDLLVPQMTFLSGEPVYCYGEFNL
jgi:predicted amidohydrolase